ncbi:MAG: MarR family transcriptional regulator [Propionivibrio sp.]|nr:MarR family transcriptional regulator [Candidatus Propionivibrio aalborgensis]MBK7325924.1 MarR family transcriptional regulator [Propionivibrio sp.]MBK7564039.1 MarR family transcriptional regulator [Propionivibrio sp.]HRC60043.1 MarR family transcriptional regulator [Candidatus Propionivibrio aalborgensis]
MEKERAEESPSTHEIAGKGSVPSALDVAAAEEAFSMVLRLVRAVQSGMQSIDATQGMSGSQLLALWQISAQPGLRVAELAEALHIHPSTASNLLDKIEVRGLVRRERSDADNRVVRLFLNDSGIDVVRDLPGPLQGRLRYALREVPLPVLKGLVFGLTSVLDLMGE